MSAADRRDRERFDIVGALWGQLEVGEPARVVNVSTSGVLLETCVTFALGGEQTLQLMVDGQPVLVDTIVRRVVPIEDGRPYRFEVALEFVAPPVPVIASVEQLAL
jgi:hypothetical protein